jgi:hypothetical protein
MAINKLDLLAKGWSTAEINKASKILEEAENKKSEYNKFSDKLLFIIMGILMIGNGFVSSIILVPFIYTIKGNFIFIISGIIGVVFSALFTIVIYDMERIHHKHETNLFIAYIVNGLVNSYLIVEYTASFGLETKAPLTQNVYYIAGAYFLAFMIPQIIYQMSKKNEVDIRS